MSYCKLSLDNLYYAGGTIRGKLVCVFNSEKTVRAIKVRIIGKEHTEWMERETYREGDKRKTRYVQYRGDNDFITTTMILHGGGESITMGRGRYEYDFSYIIPKNSPSTFEGTYGWIRYRVWGIVDRPMKFDIEDERHFMVRAPIDFNDLPRDLQEPRQASDEKYACCCCCAHGPISMDMYLNKNGYVLGEIMHIKLDVTNLANLNVENIKIKLQQNIKFKVTSPRIKEKYETNLLGSLHESGVGAHGQNTYNLQLEVPSQIELPNFKNANLFDVHYTIEATSVLPTCHTDLDIKLYPTLGHIQLYGVQMNHSQQQNASPPSYIPTIEFPDDSETTNQNAYPPSKPPFPPYSDVCPPYPTFPSMPSSDGHPPMPMPMPSLPMPMPGGSERWTSAPKAAPEKFDDGGCPSAPDPNLDYSNPSAPPPTYEDASKEKK